MANIMDEKELADALRNLEETSDPSTDSDKLKKLFDRGYAGNTGMESCEIPLDDIKIFEQVRTVFKDEEIEELAESIKLHGLLTPITVVRLENNKFRLICGEKRYRACRKLGLQRIAANIFSFKELPEWDKQGQIIILQIIENLQRSNPDLSDYVMSVDKLRQLKPGLTGDDLVKVMNKGRSSCYELLSFSKLDDDEKEKLIKRDLPIKYVRAYVNIKNKQPELCVDILNKANDLKDQELCGLISAVQAKANQQVTVGDNKEEDKNKEKDKKKGESESIKPQSVNYKKIDKYVEGLSASVDDYIYRNNLDFAELVAKALEEYLASHKV